MISPSMNSGSMLVPSTRRAKASLPLQADAAGISSR
jgi:hypothetical protein